MIEFTQLRFKNFISYSNAWTIYTFQEGITRISGINGQGKSTIVDAIYYALFGKSFRGMNLPSMVNSKTRKDLCVELELTTSGFDFKIIRGIKPNRFEIYKTLEGAEWSRKNLVPQDANKKNYQKILESIIGCNEDIFLQIGIKSLTRYGSFLTLPKAKKRDIVENIFGLEIISEMGDLNKQVADTAEQTIRDLRRDESNTELLIEQERKNLENLKRIKREMEKNIEAENAKTKTEIGHAEILVKKLKDANLVMQKKKMKITQWEYEIDAEKNTIKKFEKAEKKILDRITFEKQKIDFVMGYCSTCPNIGKMKDDLNIEILEQGLLDSESKKETYLYHIEELQDFINAEKKTTLKHPELIARLEAKEREINRLKGTLKNILKDAVVINETQYLEHKNRLQEIMNQIDTEHDNLKYYKAIHLILSDDGIKSFVIKKYLPLLNKLMNTYLQKFGIDLELEFDSELDIEIKTKFKESYAYESFSEGEKKRIDGAMMFTFLEFCKMKHSNSSLNILILDEFSSGLDPEGENFMHDILKDIVEKENKEIITLSPTPLVDPDKIDRHINVTMERGFSKLELIAD